MRKPIVQRMAWFRARFSVSERGRWKGLLDITAGWCGGGSDVGGGQRAMLDANKTWVVRHKYELLVCEPQHSWHVGVGQIIV